MHTASKYRKRGPLSKELCFLSGSATMIDVEFFHVLGSSIPCYILPLRFFFKVIFNMLVHEMIVTISILYISLKLDLDFLFDHILRLILFIPLPI